MRALRGLLPALLALTACGRSAQAPAPRDFAAHPAVADVPAPDVLYAVSDVHGGYDRLMKLLVLHQVVAAVPASPDAARWAGGAAVLVVVGDLIDKGPQGLEVIEALRALEADAAGQGGRVVVLVGNHEAEFLVDPGNSKADGDDGIDAELRADGLDPEALAAGVDPRGAWLRERPLAARVGAWFFAHAGNSKGRSLAELERALEAALAGGGYAADEITGSDSLLEARDWYAGDDGLGARYAAALGAKHLVFGHDPHALGPDGAIATAQGGALFRVDCGMSPGVDYSEGALLRVTRAGGQETAEALSAQGSTATLWTGE
jgi:hypothetical protein